MRGSRVRDGPAAILSSGVRPPRSARGWSPGGISITTTDLPPRWFSLHGCDLVELERLMRELDSSGDELVEQFEVRAAPLALAAGMTVLDGGLVRMVELARANACNVPEPAISRAETVPRDVGQNEQNVPNGRLRQQLAQP